MQIKYRDTVKEWVERQCEVVRVDFQSCPEGVTGCKARVFVKPLLNISIPQGQEDIAAFPTSRDDCPFKTKKDAKNFLQPYKIGSSVECYTDGVNVRLSVPELPALKLKTTAAVLFAVFSGLLFLIYVFKLSCKGEGQRNEDEDMGRVRWGRFHFDPPPNLYKSGRDKAMGANDARLLVRSLREYSSGNEKEKLNSVCPICLEVFEDGMAKSDGRISCGEEEASGATRNTDEMRARSSRDSGNVSSVQLPCRHEYHEVCITEWFKRGGPSCPYCFVDVQAVVCEEV